MHSTSAGITDVQVRSNLLLQILLWLNVYEFSAWSLVYGFHILYDMSKFWNTQGIFIILGYLAANVCEFVRLYAGYAGNLKSKPEDFNRFLVMTPLILLPILLFLLITVKKFNFLISILTYVLLGLMSLEFMIGIFCWQKVCTYQRLICKVKREMILQGKNSKMSKEESY